MINILIIDDEPFVTKGLTKLLTNNGYTVTAFSNPHAALEYAAQEHPIDIVISDIQMPEIDGISLCFQIKALHPCEIIIISGYQSFTYAQQCIELNTVKYLLKPINQKELLSLVGDLSEKIRRRRSEKHTDALKNKYLLLKYLSDTANGINNENIVQIQNLIAFPNIFNCFCVGVLTIPAVSLTSFTEYPDVLFMLQEFLAQHIQGISPDSKDEIFVSEFQIHRYIFVIPFEKEKSRDIAASIITHIHEAAEIDVVLNISAEHTGIFKLPEAIRECLESLCYISLHDISGSLHLYQPGLMDKPIVSNTNDFSIMRFQYYAASLSDCLLSEDAMLLIREVLEHLFIELKNLHMSVSAAKRVCEKLLLCVNYECIKFITANSSEQLSSFINMNNVAHALLMTDLEEALFTALCTLSRNITYLQKSKTENIISMVNHLLRTDCAGITLQSAAEHIGIHPSYLSLIFKEKSNQNFKDYVLHYKMEQAKRLLAIQNLKIYQIAESLGYNDIDYFSRVFKKQFQVTPAAYRDSLRNK